MRSCKRAYEDEDGLILATKYTLWTFVSLEGSNKKCTMV